jgi:hypothetical protein
VLIASNANSCGVCIIPLEAKVRLRRFKYLARPSVIPDTWNHGWEAAKRPDIRNWEENHMNSYSWIRVVTDDWEYTERVA